MGRGGKLLKLLCKRIVSDKDTQGLDLGHTVVVGWAGLANWMWEGREK